MGNKNSKKDGGPANEAPPFGLSKSQLEKGKLKRSQNESANHQKMLSSNKDMFDDSSGFDRN